MNNFSYSGYCAVAPTAMGSGVKFTMAIETVWKNPEGCENPKVKQDGEYSKYTHWMTVKCWGHLAKYVMKRLEKGHYVAVTGKLDIKQTKEDGSIFLDLKVSDSDGISFVKPERLTITEPTFD